MNENLIKFTYSEDATKFDEMSNLVKYDLVFVKTKLLCSSYFSSICPKSKKNIFKLNKVKTVS